MTASTHHAGVISGTVGFASRAVVQFLLFGVTIIATRQLSIADFGAYALGSLFLVLARQLFYVGPYEYLLKTPERENLASACFGANLVQAAMLAAVLAAIWLAAPLMFGAGAVGDVLGLLIPSVFLVAATAWYEAVLLRRTRVRRYYASTLIGDTIGSAVAVMLLLNGFGVVSLVLQTYVRLLVLLALYVAATRKRPHLRAGWNAVATVLRWSRARYAAVLLNFTSAYGADFVLGVSLSPAATGLYRASNRIVSTLTDLFAQPLQKIAQTNLSASVVRNQEIGTSWLTMLSGVGAIAWAALLTLAYLAPDLVPLALGEKWAPAVPIVSVFCLIKAFALLDAVTTSCLVCHDRQRAMLKVQIGSAVGVIALAYAVSPWGAAAVAVAVGLVSTTMSVIYGVMVMRLSRAGADALASLARTAAPPVLSVAAALAALDLLVPQLAGLEAVLAGSAAAGAAFVAGVFSVRHRMLAAIGSLGHLPGTPARAAGR